MTQATAPSACKSRVRHRIYGGPSREELFDCLRLFNEARALEFLVSLDRSDVELASNRSNLHFYLQGLRRVRGVVSGIKAEDSGGNSWVIEGYLLENDKAVICFSGYYDTQRRKGNLDLVWTE